jgi:hypothetical protein
MAKDIVLKDGSVIENGQENEITEAVVLLFSGVTQEQLDEWKVKYKEVHIIRIALNEHETLTGYFKKPDRNVLSIVVNLAQDKKIYEAREFLLINTFIGGDKTITTNMDASVPAQTKLWTQLNFLTAEGMKY